MTTNVIPEIENLQTRYEEADAAYDRAFDDDSVSKREFLMAGAAYQQAWEAYAQACREAGICVRPDCWESVVAANQRLCPTHRSDR